MDKVPHEAAVAACHAGPWPAGRRPRITIMVASVTTTSTDGACLLHSSEPLQGFADLMRIRILVIKQCILMPSNLAWPPAGVLSLTQGCCPDVGIQQIGVPPPLCEARASVTLQVRMADAAWRLHIPIATKAAPLRLTTCIQYLHAFDSHCSERAAEVMRYISVSAMLRLEKRY